MIVRQVALAVALFSSGCGQPGGLETKEKVEQEVTRPAIPRTRAIVAGDFWLIVSRDGGMQWNGQPIDESTLQDYSRDVSRLPREAGRLVVQFEPGTQQERIRSIRRLMSESELCQQKRCAEAAWDAPRP